MFFTGLATATIAALALGVSAQQSVGPCVDACFDQSVSPSTCASVQDIQCMCTNTDFQNTLTNCIISSGCSQDEINKLLSMQAAEC